MKVVYLILMGFLGVAMLAFVAMLIGFGYFSYKEKEEKAVHAFFWTEDLRKIRSPEEMQEELEGEFPAGASVEDVVAKMRQHKAKCMQDRVLPPDAKREKAQTVRYCSYEPEIFFLTTKKTLVSIYHSDNKVENISVTQKSVGLEL